MPARSKVLASGMVVLVGVGAVMLLRESPKDLNDAAWNVVRSAGASPAAYERALRQAELACERDPGRAGFLNTLGLAQYRAGHHAEAVATLERADELNRSRVDGPHHRAFDLLPLAMARFQLDETEEAQRILAEARSLVRAEKGNELPAELRELLGEAEELLGGG